MMKLERRWLKIGRNGLSKTGTRITLPLKSWDSEENNKVTSKYSQIYLPRQSLKSHLLRKKLKEWLKRRRRSSRNKY